VFLEKRPILDVKYDIDRIGNVIEDRDGKYIENAQKQVEPFIPGQSR
jgi:hypothetical protein